MTYTEMASAMRRVADALDKVVKLHRGDMDTGKPQAMIEGEAAVGAAGLLCYLRDLFTQSKHETFDRATILVLLETISRDEEIFPCGIGTLMWGMEDDDDSTDAITEGKS